MKAQEELRGKRLEGETPEGPKDHGLESRKKPGVRLSQHQEALTGKLQQDCSLLQSGTQKPT